jgi:hypothetical protein
VDLGRFELPTSSMPFKKYQSLADISPKIKDLADGGLDAIGFHDGLLSGLGLLSDSG